MESHLYTFDHIGDGATSSIGTSSTAASSKLENGTVEKLSSTKVVGEAEHDDDTAANQAKPTNTSVKAQSPDSVTVPSGSDLNHSMNKMKVRKSNKFNGSDPKISIF